MSAKQKSIAKKHGTPEEFRKAIEAAWDFLTDKEQKAAIEKYERE